METVYGGSVKVDADTMFTHALKVARTQSVAYHAHKYGDKCETVMKQVKALTDEDNKFVVAKDHCWAYFRG